MKRLDSDQQPHPPFPKQHLSYPGIEADLKPAPRYEANSYKAAEKLKGKVALITGGDSGIGRAVANLYAKEGADVAITYLEAERKDADQTRQIVEKAGRKCVLFCGDLCNVEFPQEIVERTVRELGKLDILVSNSAYQAHHKDISEIPYSEWQRTFQTNVDALFLLCQSAIPHMKPGSSIIATSSITGIVGSAGLLDYSATKGAINAFVKSLAQMVVNRGIRVNAVAPGPVWTPLNPADAGVSAEKVSWFGSDVPYGRPAQPEEIAPAYVFLASEADSSYITGLVLSELGGETIN